MREAAHEAGAWVRHWALALADGTTILPGGGTRFTPGLLSGLQREIATLDEHELRWLLTAALVNTAAVLMDELPEVDNGPRG